MTPVSPTDPGVILATTAEGVTSGALNRSKDGGTTWQKVATLPGGQPQALTAVSAEHVLAATQTGVFESKDGGKTFTKRLAVASSGGH